jgi:hypothetical protein
LSHTVRKIDTQWSHILQVSYIDITKPNA